MRLLSKKFYLIKQMFRTVRVPQPFYFSQIECVLYVQINLLGHLFFCLKPLRTPQAFFFFLIKCVFCVRMLYVHEDLIFLLKMSSFLKRGRAFCLLERPPPPTPPFQQRMERTQNKTSSCSDAKLQMVGWLNRR